MNLANKILSINFRETGLQRLSSNEEKIHQLRMNATDTMFMSVAYHITTRTSSGAYDSPTISGFAQVLSGMLG